MKPNLNAWPRHDWFVPLTTNANESFWSHNASKANDVQANRNALELGTNLDSDMQIRSVLGNGGFGITYLVRDNKLNSDLVIKEFFPADWVTRVDGQVLPNADEASRQNFAHFLARFLDEARHAASLRHPNLVSVHRYFEANGTGYFAMPWESGETLAQRLVGQQKLFVNEALAILDPLLDGLQCLHRAGLVHRDVKPENIYLRSSGSPLLLDFGAARLAGASKVTMTMVFTPGYAPPEQCIDGGAIGAFTDVYAAGAVLFRMLSGKEPENSLARKASEEAVGPVALERAMAAAQVPPEVAKVVLRAMALSVADRIADIATLRLALQSAATPVTVRVAPRREPELHAAPVTKSRVRRGRLALVLGAPMVAIALIFAALQLFSSAPSANEMLLRDVHASLPKTDLQVSVILDPEKDSYVEGEDVSIGFETAEDAYAAVFVYGEDGSVNMLYPNFVAGVRSTAGDMTWVGNGESRTKIRVTPPFGNDLVHVVAFRQLDDLNLLLGELKVEKVADALYTVEEESLRASVRSLSIVAIDPDRPTGWGDAVVRIHTTARSE